MMSKKPREEKESDVVSRRGFLTHAAAAGAGGILAPNVVPAVGAESAPPLAHPAKIPKRPFGGTGTEISIVGLGAGSRFLGPIPDDESAAELLQTAIEQGLEFVETGANYGPDGLSEKRIGLAMTTHRDRVFLETKIDERSYDGAMREMERSLQRMNTDHLDLVLHHLLWNPEMVKKVTGPDGAEHALRRMVDEGVVRFRGFSAHTVDAALAGIEQLETHAVQLPLNAVRVPDFEPDAIPAAVEKDMAIIAMKTCGNGFFFPANANAPDRIEEYGPPPGAWDRWDLPTWTEYIHYSLSLPIATATIGIDSYFTLNGVRAAASSFNPLSREEMASITRRAKVFETTGYWIPREARGAD
jgi:aryl-alcohol dehydrogenase-like predicted oxidoreductase